MKSNPLSLFQYNYRAPGSEIAGPVRYAIGQSVEGLVLVGRSQHGLCAIFLGSDAEGLCAQLSNAFPQVEREEDAESLDRDLRQVIDFIDKDVAEGVIALDIGGTPFQQNVWKALCAIPAGQTRSYSEVAAGLDAPAAVRAVGGACAANVFAIAIPCHRVVRSDGSISGYLWGVERKRTLLAKERTQ